jgi:hypothetical protein
LRDALIAGGASTSFLPKVYLDGLWARAAGASRSLGFSGALRRNHLEMVPDPCKLSIRRKDLYDVVSSYLPPRHWKVLFCSQFVKRSHCGLVLIGTVLPL